MTGPDLSPDPGHERERGISLVELLVAMFATSILVIGVGAVFTGALSSLGVVTAKGDLTSDVQLAMQTVTQSLRAGNPVQNATAATGGIVTATATPPMTTPLTTTTTATSIVFRADLPEPRAATWGPVQLILNSSYQGTLTASRLWPYQVEYYLVTSGCGTGAVQAGVMQALTPAVFNPVTAAVSYPNVPVGARKTRCVLRTTSTSGISFRYWGPGTNATGNNSSACVIPDGVAPTPSAVPTPSTTTAVKIKSVEVTMVAQDKSGRQVSLLNQICLTN
jgi:hypothetical protein